MVATHLRRGSRVRMGNRSPKEALSDNRFTYLVSSQQSLGNYVARESRKPRLERSPDSRALHGAEERRPGGLRKHEEPVRHLPRRISQASLHGLSPEIPAAPRSVLRQGERRSRMVMEWKETGEPRADFRWNISFKEIQASNSSSENTGAVRRPPGFACRVELHFVRSRAGRRVVPVRNLLEARSDGRTGMGRSQRSDDRGLSRKNSERQRALRLVAVQDLSRGHQALPKRHILSVVATWRSNRTFPLHPSKRPTPSPAKHSGRRQRHLVERTSAPPSGKPRQRERV